MWGKITMGELNWRFQLTCMLSNLLASCLGFWGKYSKISRHMQCHAANVNEFNYIPRIGNHLSQTNYVRPIYSHVYVCQATKFLMHVTQIIIWRNFVLPVLACLTLTRQHRTGFVENHIYPRVLIIAVVYRGG